MFEKAEHGLIVLTEEPIVVNFGEIVQVDKFGI